MGANQQFWRRRGGERVLRLGDVPSKARPDTMLQAMQALQRHMARAVELTEIRDCERRLQIILSLYEAEV